MTDGYDFDYVIDEGEVITIVKNGVEYQYERDIGEPLMIGAIANGVEVITLEEMTENLNEWLSDVGGWDTYVEGYDDPKEDNDNEW